MRSSPDSDSPMTEVVERQTTKMDCDPVGPEADHPIVERRWRPVHLVWIALALLGVSLLSLWVGTRIKSPAQAAADAAPPTPSVITAPVVFQELAEQVVVRGTAELDGIGILAVSSENLSVVTDVRAFEGDEVASGDVPVVLSGRPVIVLTGPLPAYRDLTPGSVGPDVAQLQAALIALGYSTSDPDPTGSFGPATQDMVGQLYVDLGFEPALTSPDAFLALGNAERAVAAAKDNFALAKSDMSAAQTAQERSIAQIALAQADRALEAAEEEAMLAERQHGVMFPLPELMFVPDREASVLESNAVVGRPVLEGTVLMTLGAGSARVKVELAESDRLVFSTGTAVEVNDPSGETRLEGRVEGIETLPSQDPSLPHLYVAWVTTTEPVPDELIDQLVQVVVTTSTTAGKVLTVPVAAVSGHADGTTTVSVLKDGTPIPVEVEVGLSADGYVEIEPLESDSLQEGDQVVLGTSGTD